MAEIKIYGDIVPFKWYNDGSEYDLKDLANALDGLDVKEGDEVIVGIHTFGGCTTTAFGMYNKLQRFKKEKKINLTTRVDGWCASSGVILLLAGDKRVGNKFAEPFVHNAWTWIITANKREAQKVMEDLIKVDNQIATLYEDRTKIDKTKALQLMDSDTFISVEDCMTYGFYTELEDVYAAENSIIFNSLRDLRKSNNNNSKMSGKAQNGKPAKKTLFGELKNLLKDFSGKGSNNKIIYTAEQEELDFYELENDATPVVGDKALFNGKPAGDSNNGEYVIAETGETYKFTGEELTEIVSAEPTDETKEDVEALKQENEDLKAENEKLKASNSKQKETISSLNAKVKTAEKIVEKVNALDLSIPEDEDEPDELKESQGGTGAAPRNSKKPVVNKVPVRNLFKDIK